MKIKQKFMFLGIIEKVFQENKYYQIKILDKEDNESYNLTTTKPLLYNEYKLYNDYEFTINIGKGFDKDRKPIIKLGLVE